MKMLRDDHVDETRKVLVGIRFDSECKELIGWAIVKVAEPHDHVVAVHVCRYPDDACEKQKLLDDYIDIYKGLCDLKKVKISGKILRGKSISKSLVKEAKDGAAVAVVLGISRFGAIGGWLPSTKYFAKHLPSTTEIFTVHNGKLVFKRSSNGKDDLKSSSNKSQNPTGNHSEFGDSELSDVDSVSYKMMAQNSESSSSDASNCELLENKYGIIERSKAPLRSVSFTNEKTEQRPGWPLLRRSSLPTQRALDSRKMSVVQWVMTLPDRSPPDTPQSSCSDSCSSKSESPLGRDSSCDQGAFSRRSSQSLWSELPDEPGLLSFESNFSDFTWFSHEVLRHSTSEFSSDNLIGKGGCSRVYKGTFLDGRQVAVKVLKSSKQAWKDFSLEVTIMSSLRHKNITPLLGVCIDNSELICVYEFMSKGSLEDNLHGNKENSALSWDARYRVAVGIAEALHHLHAGCSKPVIHRDVKSSNILLSDSFEPQLSDFGLAIRGPNSLPLETYTDVVGTFGYLAPEYFMYGKVTDKLDVYSFGVVLLELLSGRKTIDSSKRQESLVMWAKPVLESGDLRGFLDPSLQKNYDELQMRRMVLAATLCLTRAARLRPNMGQVLKLLKGEETIESWAKCNVIEQQNGEDDLNVHDEEDEVYQNSSAKQSHLDLALLDVEEGFTYSSVEPVHSPCLGDFLRCH